jgi:protein TonB
MNSSVAIFLFVAVPAAYLSPQEPSASGPIHVHVTQNVSQGLLIRKVAPKYPKEARNRGIQGTVVLRALIGKDGVVKELSVLSGDPLLSPAALEAVKQWKYKPYYYNGEAVEVDTDIRVNFVLNDGG